MKSTKLFKQIQDIKNTKTYQGTDQIRLSTYLSRAGVCSRRQADEYIQLGKVKVNNKNVTQLGSKVGPKDKVYFDGMLVPLEDVQETKVYLYRKAVGVECTRKGREGVPTIYDFLSKNGFSHLMKVVSSKKFNI